MTNPENEPRASEKEARTRGWTLRLPVALIIVALVALVVVPLVLQSRTQRVERHRDEVAQPARDLVNTIQHSVAREMGALRGFVITGDEAFLERYEESLEEERAAHDKLTSLVAEMSPEVGEAFAELRSLAARWHGRVTEAEILSRQLVPDEFVDRIPSEEVRYEQTLEAAEELRARIVDEVERNRREIQLLERASLIVTVLLALLAFGAALGALWLGRRLRALATEAETRRDEVERVIEGRSRLMRGITHDLKNPLGAARGHIELLLEGIVDEPERRRDSLERSDRAIGTALEIIDDLLELSRAEAGEIRLHHRPTDLAAVVRETAEDQEAEAGGAGLAFELDVPDDPPPLKTDGRRVREIVRNLVSNAIKYTPRGGSVTVRVRTRSDGGTPGGGGWVAIDVSDTGPGIPPEDRERIFQEFARLGDGEDGGEDGIGLGLAISRQVARLLGGEIEVESQVGRGSTFTLWLPLEPATARRDHDTRSPSTGESAG